VLARGWDPLGYFFDPREGYYNTFDALVVLLSYVFFDFAGPWSDFNLAVGTAYARDEPGTGS
jgi:hypothetical protein